MADAFTVYNTAVAVYASANNQKKITNLSGGSLYYKTTSAVSTSDSSIAAGSSLNIAQPYWLICANAAPANIAVFSGQEGSLRSDLPNSQPKNIANIYPATATTGTDTACSNGTAYVSSLWVPCDYNINNISYLIGSVGGTDKVVGAVWDNAGNVLGSTTTSGTTVGTAANTQTVATTATITVPANSNIWVGLTFNGTTAKFRSVAAQTSGGLLGNGVTQTFGTNAAITAPTTFTADKIPYLWIS